MRNPPRYDLYMHVVCVHVAPYFTYLMCSSLRGCQRRTANILFHYLHPNSLIIFHIGEASPQPVCFRVPHAPLLSSLFYSLAVKKVLCHIFYGSREFIMRFTSTVSCCFRRLNRLQPPPKKHFEIILITMMINFGANYAWLWPSTRQSATHSNNCLVNRLMMRCCEVLCWFDLWCSYTLASHLVAFINMRSENIAWVIISLNRYYPVCGRKCRWKTFYWSWHEKQSLC